MTGNKVETNDMTSKFRFKYNFISELSNKHTIDIEIYQSSLKSIKEIIHLANELTNGNEKEYPITIDVVANSKGSFITEIVVSFIGNGLIQQVNVLEILGFLGDTYHNFLNNDIINDIIRTGELIAFGTTLISFIQKKKGRKTKKIKEIDDNHSLVQTEDDELILTTKEVLKYDNDNKIHQELENIVNPINHKEIGSLEFFGDNQTNVPLVITLSDRDYFLSPEKDRECISEITREKQTLEVVGPVFSHHSKTTWRLKDLCYLSEFNARISDTDYLEKVDKRIIGFKSGDKIMVDLKIKQYRYIPSGMLRNEYEVVKVHDSSTEYQQINMDNTVQQTLDTF